MISTKLRILTNVNDFLINSNQNILIYLRLSTNILYILQAIMFIVQTGFS